MEAEERRPDNLPRHELVGLPVEVADAPDPTQVGLSGDVVDETLGTLRIETPDGVRTVPKRGRTFRFRLDGSSVPVDGDRIAHRPQDRTKKVRSK